MPASGANNGPQGRIQPKRAIKYNMATYTRALITMRMWHSYTTHPHENGRSSSAVSYVILRMGSSQPQKSALSPSTSAWGMAVAMS